MAKGRVVVFNKKTPTKDGRSICPHKKGQRPSNCNAGPPCSGSSVCRAHPNAKGKFVVKGSCPICTPNNFCVCKNSNGNFIKKSKCKFHDGKSFCKEHPEYLSFTCPICPGAGRCDKHKDKNDKYVLKNSCIRCESLDCLHNIPKISCDECRGTAFCKCERIKYNCPIHKKSAPIADSLVITTLAPEIITEVKYEQENILQPLLTSVPRHHVWLFGKKKVYSGAEIIAKKLKQREYDQKRDKIEGRIQQKRDSVNRYAKTIKGREKRYKYDHSESGIKRKRAKEKRYNAKHKEYVRNRRSIRYQKEKENGILECKAIGCTLHAQGGGSIGFCKNHGGGKRCLRCVDHCGRKKYRGYCYTCFISVFPEEKIHKNYKTKELAVVSYIKNEFPDMAFTNDKIIQGGSSLFRPDIFIDLITYVIIVEVDEHAHNGYDESKEQTRIDKILVDVAHRPIIFIRFNPDSNSIGPSCWTYDNEGMAVVKAKRAKEWQDRLEELKTKIGFWKNTIPDKKIVLIKLFF